MWAYVSYPSIQMYGVLLVSSTVLAHGGISRISLISPFRLDRKYYWDFAGLSICGICPASIYVLHGRYLYRSSWTAALWKRIHYDHHQDPNDLHVLFGSACNHPARHCGGDVPYWDEHSWLGWRPTVLCDRPGVFYGV